ncbi:MAG: pyridoxamine 5'-phosphate oxidase [Flavobacteriales bacterium]|nr:pyridoxamine 5'-phosphate oxidase [Flavobacteriales bacterium]
MEHLKHHRKEYRKYELSEAQITPTPFDLLANWLLEAERAEAEHTAMVLSTTVDNIPSSRVVLLKELKEEKLVFFTNYHSRKGREMLENHVVCLNFFWPNCERQVRIVGNVQPVSAQESDEYFYSRPHESQIGAMISKQSSYLESREQLEQEFENAMRSNLKPQRPEHWGGYAVSPFEIEFWQGRPSRLHDRFRYTKIEDQWEVHRLYP